MSEKTIISIGYRCEGAAYLKRTGNRTLSYPFDWIFTSIEMFKHCIDTNFKILLDKSYYKTYINPEDKSLRTHHTLYDKMNLEEPIINYHSNHFVLKGIEFTTFVHQDLNNEEVYNAYKRRCNRFIDIIYNASIEKQVELLYVIEYINDKPEFIEFYKRKIDELNIYIKKISQYIDIKLYYYDIPTNSIYSL